MKDKTCEPFNSIAHGCTRIGWMLVVVAALASWWMEEGAGGARVMPVGEAHTEGGTGIGVWVVLGVGMAGLVAGWGYGGRVFAWRFLRRDHVGAVPPWTLADAGRMWIPVLVAMVGHPVLRAHLSPLLQGVVLMGGGVVVIPALAWVVLRSRGVGWAGLGLGRAWWRGVAQGGWAWLACVPWLLGLNLLFLHGLPTWLRTLGIPIQVEAQDAMQVLWASQGDRFWMAMTLVWIVCGAAFLEEILFRGFLQGALKRHMRWQGAVCVTAVLFAAVHLDAMRFVPLFALGVLLGVVRERTRSLWAAIAMHGLNNLFGVVVLLLR